MPARRYRFALLNDARVGVLTRLAGDGIVDSTPARFFTPREARIERQSQGGG